MPWVKQNKKVKKKYIYTYSIYCLPSTVVVLKSKILLVSMVPCLQDGWASGHWKKMGSIESLQIASYWQQKPARSKYATLVLSPGYLGDNRDHCSDFKQNAWMDRLVWKRRTVHNGTRMHQHSAPITWEDLLPNGCAELIGEKTATIFSPLDNLCPLIHSFLAVENLAALYFASSLSHKQIIVFFFLLFYVNKAFKTDDHNI